MTTPAVFITGTDTNVGKTVIAAWLTIHLNAEYWKPIQSGTSEGTDTATVRHLAALSNDRFHPSAYSLNAPLSPHMAAKLEGIEIDLSSVQRPPHQRPLIIEGVGGVLVPLNDAHRITDLILHLNVPVIVVARSTLGTINHTCLTLEALAYRNIAILGVILNGPDNPANAAAITTYSSIPVLASFPHLDHLSPEVFYTLPLPSSLQKVFI